MFCHGKATMDMVIYDNYYEIYNIQIPLLPTDLNWKIYIEYLQQYEFSFSKNVGMATLIRLLFYITGVFC